jgi:hypothetical protein
MNQAGPRNSFHAIVLAASSLLALPGGVAAAPQCFKVYDGRGTLKYEGRQAPVDIRGVDSESWAQLKLRSEHLLWYASEHCKGDQAQTPVVPADSRTDAKGNAELILNRVPAFAGR